MKKFIIVLLAVVVLFSSALPKQTAHADGLTLAAIASGAYAIASASGMDFAFTGYDGLDVSQWMQNRINSWLAGRTVAEAFGSEVIRLTAGKLLIPSAAVAGIVDFLSDFITENNIQQNSVNQTSIVVGNVNGQNVYPYSTSANPGYPLTEFNVGGMPSWGITQQSTNNYGQVFTLACYDLNGNIMNGQNRSYSSANWIVYEPMGYYLNQSNNSGRIQCTAQIKQTQGNNISYFTVTVELIPDGNSFQKTISAIIPGSYEPPEGLNDLQSWEGTVANAPDTNIEDLLDDIFDQSAAGTLDVTGEVVDTPAEPVPTPAPTAAPGTIDDVIGQLGEMSGTLEGVHEGVGEAVGQLEGINEGIGSISEALEVPTASEAPTFKFDLTTLFPFCIPFDIYRFVTMFNASPVAPHVQIPFNIPAVGLQYTFDLDFSSFNSVASVLRSVELIAFCVGLAILTSKVIRW